ncbi:hypothetical protein IWX46DRAFT_591316 [Phyllosticta citricarpa]|uniref:Secreted protein n=1 Tax=Phyllosticta citricarpa TaxID=55181 RepID=A0ABR1MMX9_9PEZI
MCCCCVLCAAPKTTLPTPAGPGPGPGWLAGWLADSPVWWRSCCRPSSSMLPAPPSVRLHCLSLSGHVTLSQPPVIHQLVVARLHLHIGTSHRTYLPTYVPNARRSAASNEINRTALLCDSFSLPRLLPCLIDVVLRLAHRQMGCLSSTHPYKAVHDRRIYTYTSLSPRPLIACLVCRRSNAN